jgi:hypothetical protein
MQVYFCCVGNGCMLGGQPSDPWSTRLSLALSVGDNCINVMQVYFCFVNILHKGCLWSTRMIFISPFLFLFSLHFFVYAFLFMPPFWLLVLSLSHFFVATFLLEVSIYPCFLLSFLLRLHFRCSSLFSIIVLGSISVLTFYQFVPIFSSEFWFLLCFLYFFYYDYVLSFISLFFLVGLCIIYRYHFTSQINITSEFGCQWSYQIWIND